ncbi:hypothetical protein BBO99_00009850 [Phytophthora kernoviae]|uniref:Uncharacterized protein n=1 Tax=Phytophthora kernoviae TaxID=325452 RepID=A0A421ERX4_9STRA|nr:hypothetical protein BBI17_009903 [Phytophthora kernoviae]RLN72403.1 hypothetical protein BBO99_00009850 [Phytophthora kernoviae]
MLRLPYVVRSPRPLLAYARGFTATGNPVKTSDNAAATRRREAIYYARISRKFPAYFGSQLSMAERIQATLDAVNEMFGPKTALGVLLSNCRIVTYNIIGMRRAFKYLVSVGYTPERLRKSTRFITRSVNGILRPRSKFLQTKGVDVVENTDWIMIPEKNFIEKYPYYKEYLVQYKARQKKKAAATATAAA